jgi:hypothetical protein
MDHCSRHKTIEKGKECNFLAFSHPTCSKIAFENRKALLQVYIRKLYWKRNAAL